MMESLTERYFTIVESDNMSTLAFLVNEPEEGTKYCTLQKLNYTFPDAGDTRKKMFHLDANPNEMEGRTDIVLLTVNSEKAFLNSAVLTDNKLFVSEKPTNVGFKVIYSDNSDEYKDLKYTPNFKRPISIIDPEIPDEVRPVLYYDEKANMVKAKVKLQSNKSYIALEVKEI